MATSTIINSYNVIDWKVVTLDYAHVSNTQQSVDLTDTEPGYIAVGIVGSYFTADSGRSYMFFQNHYVLNQVLYYKSYTLNGSATNGMVHLQVLYIKEGTA